MDHDRIHRILDLNKQLLQKNKELIEAIRAHARPEAIQGIRETLRAIKGEIKHISASEADN